MLSSLLQMCVSVVVALLRSLLILMMLMMMTMMMRSVVWPPGASRALPPFVCVGVSAGQKRLQHELGGRE